MDNIDPAVVIIVALISPLITYLIAAKKLSGRIKDSDATELWSESRAIREWSTERVKELNEVIARLETRMTEVEKMNSELAEENRKLSREVYDLRNQVHDLEENKIVLLRKIDEEQVLITQLRWEAENSPRRRHSDPTLTQKPEEPDERDT